MADLTLTVATDQTSMASTSTSASTSYANNNYYVYDIFINHRGPDCKKTLATDLYNRLGKHGLRVFLDEQELQEGDPLTSQIEGAIQTASVHIAIFSPRYAESSWCLKELVLMLESRATIIPVFYHVKPSELRWTQGDNGVYARILRMLPWFLCLLCCTRDQNGVYARDLGILEGKKTLDSQTGQQKPRYDSNTIGKWRKALSNVADISGFDLQTYNGDERQLIEQVVERVLKRVPRKLHVSKYPVALDQKVEDFERYMVLQQQRGQTRVIGIVGLGGIGKTTLAKEIFNRHRSNYDRSCFLFDVRDSSLKSLQSMLLKDLTIWNGHINSTDEGIEMLRRYLSSSKALIILDDVDHIHQMDALLLPAKDVLRSGSLIIVTSRDKDVLTNSGIVEASIFKLTGLDPEHSPELFCWHAFHQSHALVGFEKIVNEFLNACNGLPLSLIVLGAHLHGKIDLKYWEAQLRKTSKALPKDVQKSLKISYDGLDEEEKQIFLDIACFFIGEDRDRAIRIWDGSGWEGGLGLQNLESKCLVEVDEGNQIKMHDHLRDLGRELAEKEPPECRLRLWRPTDSLLHLPHQSLVRGISMVPKDVSEWPPQSFRNLAELTGSLQLLRAEGYCVESILRIAQPPQLTWLCWNNCPYSSLPHWIPTASLRVLQITANELETLWSHESQAPVQMRELNIKGRLLNIPKSIGKLKHLEIFFLYPELFSRVGLKALPDEFCHLRSLKHLLLNGCSEMESLPESFGNLTNLQHIVLFNCSYLHMLPDSFGNLTNLQDLALLNCSCLQMLPDSFGNLTNLQSIDLGCSDLQMLPDSFGNLTNLQTINLSDCSHLQMLPDSFGNFTKLRLINLSNCSDLKMLPDSFGSLTNLQDINLSSCSNLQSLPISFGNLIQLKSLCLTRCQQLTFSSETLGKINTLEYFNISDCDVIEVLPPQVAHQRFLREMHLLCKRLKELPSAIGELSNLKILHLGGEMLEMLPLSFGYLGSLEDLELHFCHAFRYFPNCIKMLTRLRRLKLENCSGLVEVGALPTTLITLELRGCGALRKLGGLRGLSKLQTLNIIGCMELEELPSIETLVSLESFDVSNCVKLKSIWGLVHLTKLQTLNINGCMELEELPSIETLISLEKCAFNCVKLKSIRGLEHLSKLQRLNINGCTELEELSSIETLVSLEWLDVSNCVKLKSIQRLEHMPKLQTLNIKGCMELEELPGIETLVSLEWFNVSNCVKLKTIRGLEYLTNLQGLNIIGCMELEELPSIGTLASLGRFWGSNCVKLKSIRGLEHLTKLQWLHIDGCMELEELPSIETLVSLEYFDVSNCVKLKTIQGRLRKLQSLKMNGCMELEELPGIETMISLNWFDVSNCVKLKSIRGLEHLTKLETLNINGCLELEELPSIETLVSLEWFYASNCVRLKSIRGLEYLTKLQRLDINGCKELEELPSIQTLVSLEWLDVSNCVQLKSIRGLEHLTKLQSLNINGCIELEELPSFETLVSLEELFAFNCVKLKSIHGLGQLAKFQKLDVRECSELEELRGIEHLMLLKKLDVSGCPKLQWSEGVMEELNQRLKEGFSI